MSRTVRLTVKVLVSHKAALERLAEEEDTSAAAVVRRLVRAEAERRGVWPTPGTTLQQNAGGAA